MADLLIDSFSSTPKGEVNASVTGGVGPYTYTLNNSAPQPVTTINLYGYNASFINLSGLAFGNYNLAIFDSSNPVQTATKQFTIAAMQVAPACQFSGPGNLQGVVEVAFDDSIIYDIQVTGPNGYSENSLLQAAQFKALAVFVFMANGDYHVEGRDSNGAVIQAEDFTIECRNSEPLTITKVNPGDASTPTAKDGAAYAELVFGSYSGSNFVVQTSLDNSTWLDAMEVSNSNFNTIYYGLAVGSYTLYARVIDISTNVPLIGVEAQYAFTISYQKIFGCTNPNATNYNKYATDDDGSCTLPPIQEKAHFVVPMMNSLRFVDMVASETQPPSLDNRLYCSESWQGISRPPYYQKVSRDDIITTQFQSNYDTHNVSLINYQTGLKVADFEVKKKRQNLGVLVQYPAFIAAHPSDTTKSRLYFNSGQLPLAFVVGDRVEVLNATPASLNKEYTIFSLAFDSAQSVPFLILNLPYVTAAPIPNRINVTVQTQYDLLPYNVYEASTDWGVLPNGGYYIKIEATRAGFDNVLYKSEPFSLFPIHEGTNIVNWRNFDNTQGLDFSTGLNCGIRVESELWQRFPGGTRKTYRSPDNRLIKLSAMPQRKVKFNTFWLPPWLHEKLSIAFDFDHVEINGEEFQSEDGYAEPQYIARYALANSSISLEKVESIDTNSDDLGDVNGVAPFIVVNEKYLQI
jgi:hypothetical protein